MQLFSILENIVFALQLPKMFPRTTPLAAYDTSIPVSPSLLTLSLRKVFYVHLFSYYFNVSAEIFSIFNKSRCVVLFLLIKCCSHQYIYPNCLQCILALQYNTFKAYIFVSKKIIRCVHLHTEGIF